MSRDPLTRGQVFEARLERWLPDLDGRARAACTPTPTAVADRLVGDRRARRTPPAHDDLHRLDLTPLAWSRTGSSGRRCVGYAAYADRFAGTLAGVAERASYLTDLGVGYLHLMPLLTPRPAPNDGGYAVADYRTRAARPRHHRRPARR